MTFLTSMLSEESKVSSKRVIGFTGFMALTLTMICNSFTTLDIAPTPELVTAVEYITIGALFGTSLDKILPKTQSK